MHKRALAPSYPIVGYDEGSYPIVGYDEGSYPIVGYDEGCVEDGVL